MGHRTLSDPGGVNPQAPNEAGFHRIRFEEYQPPELVQALVSDNHEGDDGRRSDGG
jgi:hypothetical protein